MIFLNVKFIGFNYMEIHSPLNATKSSVIALQNTAERTESLFEGESNNIHYALCFSRIYFYHPCFKSLLQYTIFQTVILL